MRLPVTLVLLACAGTAASAAAPPPASASPNAAAGYAFRPDPADYYPAASGAMNEAGLVKIRLCYDINGKPVEVAVAETSGFARLDAAALRYGKAVRIRPARRDDQPIADCVTVPVQFSPPQRLAEGEAKPLPPVQVPPVLVAPPPPPPQVRLIPL